MSDIHEKHPRPQHFPSQPGPSERHDRRPTDLAAHLEAPRGSAEHEIARRRDEHREYRCWGGVAEVCTERLR